MYMYSQSLFVIGLSNTYVHICTYTDIYVHTQPILRGVTFSKHFQSSKLKARTSLFTETWPKRRSSFEL